MESKHEFITQLKWQNAKLHRAISCVNLTCGFYLCVSVHTLDLLCAPSFLIYPHFIFYHTIFLSEVPESILYLVSVPVPEFYAFIMLGVQRP